MPEASIHEDGHFRPREDEIGTLSFQSIDATIDEVAEASSMQLSPEFYLRARVTLLLSLHPSADIVTRGFRRRTHMLAKRQSYSFAMRTIMSS